MAVLDAPMTDGVLCAVIVTIALSAVGTVSVILFDVSESVVLPHVRADREGITA